MFSSFILTVSVLSVLVLSVIFALSETCIIPDNSRYSLDIKSNKINLMVALGQC